VIMLTGQGTIETAVEAMKLGAYDYLTKPYSINELDVRVRQAAEKRNLRVDNLRLRAQIERKSATPLWPKQFAWFSAWRHPRRPY
jgi:two-component system response regulator AtoC